ncbi:MAG: hypothetical protein HOP18_25150 [Deltaproteobacteria bacterium]|nr:hypothetical protein [Deltaproteobacteria bacterium]
MATIPVSFSILSSHYPARPNLTPALRGFMTSLGPGNTPCCVQVSHALNMAGQLITHTYKGQRRENARIRINGVDYYYLLAVDELERWLTLNYGPGDNVSLDGTGRRRTPRQIQASLQGRAGIVAFRTSGYGFHTELWNGRRIVQRDMNEHACFAQPRVLFWDCQSP